MPAIWRVYRANQQRMSGAERKALTDRANFPVILLHGHRRQRDGNARLYAPDPATLRRALDAIGFTPKVWRRTARSWALPAWATERALALAQASQSTGEQVDQPKTDQLDTETQPTHLSSRSPENNS